MKKKGSINPDRHDKGRVMLGIRVSPEIKALGIVAAERLHKTISEVMLDGLFRVATECGLMKDGQIAPEYKQAIEDATILVKMMNNKRSGNGTF